MAWSGDFKRRRFEELNKMKLKDRMNYHMTSEYQYILNGIADPTKTTNFSNNYTLTSKEAGHRRRYARKHGFYQSKMAKLEERKMVNADGYFSTYKAFKNFPSTKKPAYDVGDDSWKYKDKPVAEIGAKDLQKIAVKINVNKPTTYFTERFSKLLASQFSFDSSSYAG